MENDVRQSLAGLRPAIRRRHGEAPFPNVENVQRHSLAQRGMGVQFLLQKGQRDQECGGSPTLGHQQVRSSFRRDTEA